MENFKDPNQIQDNINSEMSHSYHYSYKLQGKVFYAFLKSIVETREGEASSIVTPQIA